MDPDAERRRLAEGLALVRAGDGFAAHEVFEELWRAAAPEERDFYQGLVHVAVAPYQERRAHRVGMRRQLEKARRRLAPYGPRHRGVDVAALLAWCEASSARDGCLDPSSALPALRASSASAGGTAGTSTRGAEMTSSATPDFHRLLRGALAELGDVAERMPADAVDRLVDELLGARRIAVCGAGREGLMMRALAMRLMHLGLDAHVVGDMVTPPVGAGDLLVASAGPGGVSTVLALLGVARAAGARTLVVTAQPEGEAVRLADALFLIPATTMADDLGGGASVLPMGSLFEAAQLVLFDIVSIAIRDRTGQSPEQMRARHTNLE